MELESILYVQNDSYSTRGLRLENRHSRSQRRGKLTVELQLELRSLEEIRESASKRLVDDRSRDQHLTERDSELVCQIRGLSRRAQGESKEVSYLEEKVCREVQQREPIVATTS